MLIQFSSFYWHFFLPAFRLWPPGSNMLCCPEWNLRFSCICLSSSVLFNLHRVVSFTYRQRTKNWIYYVVKLKKNKNNNTGSEKIPSYFLLYVNGRCKFAILGSLVAQQWWYIKRKLLCKIAEKEEHRSLLSSTFL